MQIFTAEDAEDTERFELMLLNFLCVLRVLCGQLAY